jgi:hypothetical protein
MAADSNLIKGEALVAQSGNVNYGEEIGKGFETIGKSIAEAKSTVEGWSDKESTFNEDMAKIDTSDALSEENEAIIAFVTDQKAKYAEAARKASRIQNKSSEEYKKNVKIMNDVNSSFLTLAKEKQNLLDDRQFNIDNPNIYSAATGSDEEPNIYLKTLTGKGGLGIGEAGHIKIGEKRWIDLKKPAQKSPVNQILTKNFNQAFDDSEKSGKPISVNKLERAGQDVEGLFFQAPNKKLLARQLLLDPVLGVVALAKEWELEGLEEPELIQLVKDRYTDLIKKQSERGVEDYDPPKTEPKDSSIFKADDVLQGLNDFVTGTGGSEDAVVKNKQFKVVQDPRDKNNPKVVMYGEDGKVGESINLYVTDKLGIPMKDARGNAILNTRGFRVLTGEYSQIKIKN